MDLTPDHTEVPTKELPFGYKDPNNAAYVEKLRTAMEDYWSTQNVGFLKADLGQQNYYSLVSRLKKGKIPSDKWFKDAFATAHEGFGGHYAKGVDPSIPKGQYYIPSCKHVFTLEGVTLTVYKDVFLSYSGDPHKLTGKTNIKSWTLSQ